ncbi:MAG: 3-isopropylmalate dehydratase small subunit [Spirochaetaceae bacterium]|jgi:3-isopropylmalate/(R)-2-methylmalate dehydratase small subunit|nr:3-isopropylmalate dehydratase small subunit [Spirochaetaceae bacterium]
MNHTKGKAESATGAGEPPFSKQRQGGKRFGGKLLFLDRNDINTDEIIPARYLNESSREALRPFLLEDLKLPGFDPAKNIAGKAALITRANFGCGSSREHAPWALEMNGINIIIAENFARIFRQNTFNCGMLAVELPASTIDEIFSEFSKLETTLAVDTQEALLVFSGGKEKKVKKVPFKLTGFERALVEAGGWVDYAESRY